MLYRKALGSGRDLPTGSSPRLQGPKPTVPIPLTASQIWQGPAPPPACPPSSTHPGGSFPFLLECPSLSPLLSIVVHSGSADCRLPVHPCLIQIIQINPVKPDLVEKPGAVSQSKEPHRSVSNNPHLAFPSSLSFPGGGKRGGCGLHAHMHLTLSSDPPLSDRVTLVTSRKSLTLSS